MNRIGYALIKLQRTLLLYNFHLLGGKILLLKMRPITYYYITESLDRCER